MDESPSLALPYLQSQQAQKHVTFNEALRRLDALEQISVVQASSGYKLVRACSRTWRLPGQERGRLPHVPDETGGAVLAFSDGTNWRRVTDRAVVS